MRFQQKLIQWLFLATTFSGAFGPLHIAGPALAFEPPVQRPLLTIGLQTGEGTHVITLDRASLVAMGMESMETTTPWYNGKVKFEGVPMTRLLEAVHAEGKTLTATALDDYISTIPVEDFAKYHVLLALKRDGVDMPIRDKGPLFIVYPYDSSVELQNQIFYSRSAWQVKRFDIR